MKITRKNLQLECNGTKIKRFNIFDQEDYCTIYFIYKEALKEIEKEFEDIDIWIEEEDDYYNGKSSAIYANKVFLFNFAKQNDGVNCSEYNIYPETKKEDIKNILIKFIEKVKEKIKEKIKEIDCDFEITIKKNK